MALEPGRRLLHYELIEKIGEGGMGVVWKARDTSLDRQVAIKVLPAAMATDADRLARLEREAKLLASLSHPNCATLHGLHEDGDVRFLVMELVVGEDLSARMARGPIPQDEVLDIGRQIAQGLEAAHAAGIVHRDLKPANIKVGTDGRVKVLDFGLARILERRSSEKSAVGPTESPTLTSGGTLAGTILGTAAYMSPEQARGHAVDRRTDVWAFGVVLYEMLSGTAAFRSDTISDTLASVLKIDPDFEALPTGVPRRIRRLVMRCLQKDPRKRLHHIADARIVLEETLAGIPDEPPQELLAARQRRRIERILWSASLVLVGVAAVIAARISQPGLVERPHRKILLALDGEDPDDPGVVFAGISPDGSRCLYGSGDKVFVRDLDDWDSHEIPAAEGADLLFWSADGRSIGFVLEKTLWRVSADGSGSSVIGELPGNTSGAAWGADGRIVLAGRYRDEPALYEVSARGGEPRALFVPEDFDDHFHGIGTLPGDRAYLVTVHRGGVMEINVLEDGELRPLLEIESRYLPEPVYSDSGHLLYTRGGSNVGIWALPFSAEGLEATGEPFLVAAGGGSPSVSRDGTLLYTRHRFEAGLQRLVWVDRRGEILETIGQPKEGLDYPTLSPDGSKIVVSSGTDYLSDRDLWIVDAERGTWTPLSPTEGAEYDPVWARDGLRVIYRHKEEDGPGLIRITDADGGGEPETIVEGDMFSLSPDGRYLVFCRSGDDNRDDLWYLELGSGNDPVPIVRTRADEEFGRVSPDGAYLAYHSDESGRDEIYIRRFPSGQGRWQASLEGGSRPRWSPKGDELFWALEGDLMAVEVGTDGELTLGTPRRLFSWEPAYLLDYREYDVTASAERFLLIAPEEDPEDSTPESNTVMLVENWLNE